MDQSYSIKANPIDLLEEIISSKRWYFTRSANDELVAEISSKFCSYRMYFAWSEKINAINFTITFDLKFSTITSKSIYELLALINEKLWIGHFDITSKSGIPAFRHTVLVNDKTEISHNILEDLVDIAIYECEKYYPAFELLLFEEIKPSEALKLSSIEVLGRA